MAMEQQPWAELRGTFADSWFSDMFSNKETEAMTKALQHSFMTNVTNQSVDDNSSLDFSADTVESFLAGPELTPSQTPTATGGFGGGVPVVKRRSEAAPAGRITKRKSRASKRAAATTFITADPANFRQMVQEVTGVKFGGLDGQFAAAQLMKEQRRAMSYMQGGIGGGCLPTLDTSAFLLEQVKGSTSSGNVNPPPRMTVAEEGDGGGGAGFGFESFCNFPTLESWKAV